MKLTFIFTDTADIASLPHDDLFVTHFEFPDEALQLSDCHERILTIARCVGQLTDAVLHISCKTLELKLYPIKSEKTGTNRVEHSIRVLPLRFERHYTRRGTRRDIKILLPRHLPTPVEYYRSNHSLFPTSSWAKTDEQRNYAETIDLLVANCLVLLNSEPPNERMPAWRFLGFHPGRADNSIITLLNKRRKRRQQAQKKQEREEQKRKASEEKRIQKATEFGIPSTEPPRTGAGRRVGAVPGKFQGIMFRSQLEIRFVTQLAAKNIRWIYEGERLGESQYLVDFYLPDLKCWVEVKGRIEPRDDYLLKEVAAYLKRERAERLFIYTQSKAYFVTAQQFREMNHKEFWSKL